ncbi:unnamed protein product, partial [Ectocarpus sp. 6 AP-2014]
RERAGGREVQRKTPTSLLLHTQQLSPPVGHERSR